MKKGLLFFVLLAGFLSHSQGQTPCTVAKYSFKGNSKDTSGNGNHLSVSGATLTKDRFGNNNQAYHFDGTQYLWAVATPAFSNDKFSTSFWAKPEDGNTANNRIIAVGPASTYWHYYANTTIGSSNKFGFVAHDVNGNYNFNDYLKQSYTVNQWVHIVSTYDGDSIRMYINGVLNFTSKVAAKVVKFTSDKYLQIGAAYYPDSPLAGFRGDLDEIGIYCKSLSGTEVKALYDKEARITDNALKLTGSTISIHPNPANNLVTIDYNIPNGMDIKGKVFNSLGHIIMNLEDIKDSGAVTVTVNNLAPGFYYIKFNDNKSGASKTIKLVID